MFRLNFIGYCDIVQGELHLIQAPLRAIVCVRYSVYCVQTDRQTNVHIRMGTNLTRCCISEKVCEGWLAMGDSVRIWLWRNWCCSKTVAPCHHPFHRGLSFSIWCWFILLVGQQHRHSYCHSIGRTVARYTSFYSATCFQFQQIAPNLVWNSFPRFRFYKPMYISQCTET